MAQTTQTAAAASAMTRVSHNHESSYNILIRSPYLSLANWKLLFHIHAFVNFRFIVPFRRTCAAFLPAVSGTVGKGLERETLCPFPRLRRFGTHYETGSKFLLLFSIKSKEEILCFAEKVLNGRMTNVVQPPLFRRTRAAFPILLLQISPERINIPHHSCQMYP
jgi:hypothetical protein